MLIHKKIINIFKENATKENSILLNYFLSNVFNSQFLELAIKKEEADFALRRMFNNSNVHVNEELTEKMWKKIQMPEFCEVILSKNHQLFSLDNWTRKIDNDFLDI